MNRRAAFLNRRWVDPGNVDALLGAEQGRL